MNKLKKLTAYFVIVITIAIISSFQVKQDDVDYNKQWQKVDEFASKGQPKSALKIVDEIYKYAKDENNSPQVVKSLIYRISLQSTYEEDHVINSISIFKNELSSATIPEKQILQSLIAELYHAYYNANRWKINQRQTLSDDENGDMETWDAIKLNQVIDLYYKASLENETELVQIPLNEFELILMQGDSSDFTLWPTLFDLLANRALTYFTSPDAELTQIATQSQTNSAKYLLPVNDFINLKINPEESTQTKVLNIFQRLLAFHKQQNNTESLADLDLRRLKYVYENSSQDNATKEKYIEALALLSEKYKKHPVYASIAYSLADLYFISGQNYIPEFDESNRYNLVIADSICNVAIVAFPNVNGSNSCRNLIEKINQIDLGFNIPVAEIPDRPILSLVKFKNVDILYFRIVASDPKANTDKNNRKEQIINELKKEAVISWKQELPKTTDHRMHSVEVKIPELKKGYYIIYASNDSLFRAGNTIKFKPIWITNLSYITSANSTGGYTDMFTIDRETGNSIGDVNITIYTRQYDNRSRTYNIIEAGKLTSDKYGYAKIESISSNNYGTYLFMFEKDDNQLFSENYLNFYRQARDTKPRVKTYLFTDRVVYRPGQTVYFKGIVVEELDGEVKLLTDYNTNLEFINASRKKISGIAIA